MMFVIQSVQAKVWSSYIRVMVVIIKRWSVYHSKQLICISSKMNWNESKIWSHTWSYIKESISSLLSWADMIWYDMIWYDMIWYDMIWYDMELDMYSSEGPSFPFVVLWPSLETSNAILSPDQLCFWLVWIVTNPPSCQITAFLEQNRH